MAQAVRLSSLPLPVAVLLLSYPTLPSPVCRPMAVAVVLSPRDAVEDEDVERQEAAERRLETAGEEE